MAFIVLFALLVFLGFILAWIVGMVAQEEVSISTCVILTVISAIAGTLAGAGAASIHPALGLLQIPLTAVFLGAMLTRVANISLKQGLVIAGIFGVVWWGTGLIIGLALAPAGTA